MQPITTSLARRQDFIKLLILGTMLAFGLGWISSYAYGAVETKSTFFILIPLVLTIVPLGYAFGFAVAARRGTNEIEAIATFNQKSKAPVRIDRYSFSESLHRIIVSITKENPALQEMLTEDLFPTKQRDSFARNQGSKSDSQADTTSTEYVAIVRTSFSEAGVRRLKSSLLIEAIEFAVLKELSLHLSSYFKDHDRSGDQLVELTREDIPGVLLKNRVLALLTAPIEERLIFRKSGIHKNPPEGTVMSIRSSDGQMFDRFDLVLPKGSKLDRPEEGSLVLSTQRGVVRISIRCEGYSANLPDRFEPLYLGMGDHSLLKLKVGIQVETELKVGSLLSPRGWEYYRWMDSFSSRLTEQAHFPNFVKRIGWESALTGYIVRRVVERRQQVPPPTVDSSQQGNKLGSGADLVVNPLDSEANS